MTATVTLVDLGGWQKLFVGDELIDQCRTVDMVRGLGYVKWSGPFSLQVYRLEIGPYPYVAQYMVEDTRSRGALIDATSYSVFVHLVDNNPRLQLMEV